jgi:hypothetical protein
MWTFAKKRLDIPVLYPHVNSVHVDGDDELSVMYEKLNLYHNMS